MMTFVPASAATPHVKHQPLQWSMGSVHKYAEPCLRPQNCMEMKGLKYAPLEDDDDVVKHLRI